MTDIKEKVIIVHLNRNDSEEVVEDKLDELEELVRSSGGQVEARVIQNANRVNATYYVGKGKAEEIKELAENLEVETVIFNNELTGSQMKNLEDVVDKKIVDRTGLILDIFAQRARTKEAKLQVKLAQLEYRLPRLVGYRNYLSREGAGIGTRGPGEQKLEIDRRSVQGEIKSIKDKLENEKSKRKIKSKRRLNANIPIVSLIGYSNAGKSTILNQLLEEYGMKDKAVYSDDMLFATLDTSARSLVLDNNKEIIVSDTVGFVSDLPTKLIESFKSTLEEIEISDLIIIVIDSSNIDYNLQLEATMDVLKDLDVDQKKVLYCFNKVDKGIDIFFNDKGKEVIRISALKKSDIIRLAEKIQGLIFSNYDYYNIMIKYGDIGYFEKNMENFEDLEKEYLNDGIQVRAYISKEDLYKYEEFLVEK